ncbi:MULTISPECIES: phosphopantetheine-binding protein [Streptomyces]|uniref:Phosphopantetheine-binding protein n=1 Tax=Streptomyces olivaceus TaxID=47716 RepID=A0A2R3ZQ15_STROV|nr:MULTISPECIES: phosphopantetheine-binding protein [Streptomyces]AVR52608.1 phosphopantetheine-binding protein [Streptomyces olivaceus]AZG02877.1 phosphopantetheine-binding protein [Streptomyces olivaceus]MBZ6089956.1 phosphopantetheine-binding protein [Streptomyces olivaceus]MBZ6098467.1 phosphopantetheine-binding protein [Streptomyces olivaceus]MBZ6101306.1 phosphopantetheine-binding protein [Streptomyces olivaceus]
MSTPTLTRQDVAEEVARLLGRVPEDLPEDENLVLMGLGSLEVMQLVNQWRRRGIEVDFGALVASPTLGGWWAQLVPESEGPR